ncbi:hypothetical protein GWI33_014114 [Rhynchophorus ferrugineus]|uniref:Uncharacterized protein n=1 Tax=Rhynchophorus ferrugineus TaxID=354439 RepID=A0A834M9E0_RHYFE|nr:hypothetical protein GWI33_014114 [Rhynchophorus ferrugineus]
MSHYNNGYVSNVIAEAKSCREMEITAPWGSCDDEGGDGTGGEKKPGKRGKRNCGKSASAEEQERIRATLFGSMPQGRYKHKWNNREKFGYL